MANGMRIMSADNTVVWDSSTRPTEIINTCHAGTTDGSTPPDTRLTSNNYWVYIIKFDVDTDAAGYQVPSFTVNNNRIAWHWEEAYDDGLDKFIGGYTTKSGFNFMYGIYL